MYPILGPLNELAARHYVSIIGNCHTNKADTMSAKHRITGSTAILAAARCASIVLRDPDNEDRRRRFFSRLNRTTPPATIPAWPSDHHRRSGRSRSRRVVRRDRRDHGRRGPPPGGGGPRQDGTEKDPESLDAVRFLKELLKNGPVDATRIEAEAKAGGTSLRPARGTKRNSISRFAGSANSAPTESGSGVYPSTWIRDGGVLRRHTKEDIGSQTPVTCPP